VVIQSHRFLLLQRVLDRHVHMRLVSPVDARTSTAERLANEVLEAPGPIRVETSDDCNGLPRRRWLPHLEDAVRFSQCPVSRAAKR
jgi:hypothetical protein